MLPAERASASNGIWLCQVHAKLIDDDELRFPSHLLKRWKRVAEDRARRRLANPGHDDLLNGLISLRRNIKNATVNDLRLFSANFLHDVGAFPLWGPVRADLVRMLIFELAWNAYRHGGASFAQLISTRFRITLRTDASDFSLADLRSAEFPGGGYAAVDTIERTTKGALKLRYRHTGSRARVEIVDVANGGPADNPCGVDHKRLTNSSPKQLSYLSDCDEIHVYAGSYWSFSDCLQMYRSIQQLGPDKKIVVHNASLYPGLAQYLAGLDGVRLA